MICGKTVYRQLVDGMLLLCLDRASIDWVMREVHAGVCGPHMGGHMLSRKIMRTDYFWLTMETDCCQFVQRCLKCQVHGDLIHVPPSELHALTSPWPFLVWGIDIIGKISLKSSSGHEMTWLTSITSSSGWRLHHIWDWCHLGSLISPYHTLFVVMESLMSWFRIEEYI